MERSLWSVYVMQTLYLASKLIRFVDKRNWFVCNIFQLIFYWIADAQQCFLFHFYGSLSSSLQGLSPLPGSNNESWCQGLDGLASRSAEYYKQGARFAKWWVSIVWALRSFYYFCSCFFFCLFFISILTFLVWVCIYRRTVVSVPCGPSALAVKEAAWGLARYAAISQVSKVWLLCFWCILSD